MLRNRKITEQLLRELVDALADIEPPDTMTHEQIRLDAAVCAARSWLDHGAIK